MNELTRREFFGFLASLGATAFGLTGLKRNNQTPGIIYGNCGKLKIRMDSDWININNGLLADSVIACEQAIRETRG
jgi:hypothetical protein